MNLKVGRAPTHTQGGRPPGSPAPQAARSPGPGGRAGYQDGLSSAPNGDGRRAAPRVSELPGAPRGRPPAPPPPGPGRLPRAPVLTHAQLHHVRVVGPGDHEGDEEHRHPAHRALATAPERPRRHVPPPPTAPRAPRPRRRRLLARAPRLRGLARRSQGRRLPRAAPRRAPHPAPPPAGRPPPEPCRWGRGFPAQEAGPGRRAGPAGGARAGRGLRTRGGTAGRVAAGASAESAPGWLRGQGSPSRLEAQGGRLVAGVPRLLRGPPRSELAPRGSVGP